MVHLYILFCTVMFLLTNNDIVTRSIYTQHFSFTTCQMPFTACCAIKCCNIQCSVGDQHANESVSYCNKRLINTSNKFIHTHVRFLEDVEWQRKLEIQQQYVCTPRCSANFDLFDFFDWGVKLRVMATLKPLFILANSVAFYYDECKTICALYYHHYYEPFFSLPCMSIFATVWDSKQTKRAVACVSCWFFWIKKQQLKIKTRSKFSFSVAYVSCCIVDISWWPSKFRFGFFFDKTM